jgi:ElaB/YqjD/DUF883 family membrane-anchored ribosome-binding protein
MRDRAGTPGAQCASMSQEQTTENAADGAIEFEHDVAAIVERARETIEEFVQEQPHAALGVAAAAGFILGGGLTPRRLLRLGWAAGGPALSRQLLDQVVRIAGETLEGESRSAPKRTSSPRRRAKADT